MAGLNLIPIQDNIADYIRAEFPGYELYEDTVLDDEYLLRVDGNVKPYIVLRWGGLMRSPQNASFGGVRLDEYTSNFDLNIIAPTPRQAREAMNIILDSLIGWKPDAIAPLIPLGGGVYVQNDVNGRPHVYIASHRLEFVVNADNPGSPITP